MDSRSDSTWLTLAVEDNVAWCDAVLGARGAAGQLSDSCWICADVAPPYYPNLITRQRNARIDEPLTELCQRLPAGFGVKDSFADLDLAPLGFRVIVDACWYLREAAPVPGWPGVDPAQSAATVRVARNESDLAGWVNAWGQTPDGAPVFAPRLVMEPKIQFLSVATDAGIAGLIAHDHGGVVGVSNAFGSAAGILMCLERVSVEHPGSAMVGYGDPDELGMLAESGFRGLGNLRVWTNA